MLPSNAAVRSGSLSSLDLDIAPEKAIPSAARSCSEATVNRRSNSLRARVPRHLPQTHRSLQANLWIVVGQVIQKHFLLAALPHLAERPQGTKTHRSVLGPGE